MWVAVVIGTLRLKLLSFMLFKASYICYIRPAKKSAIKLMEHVAFQSTPTACLVYIKLTGIAAAYIWSWQHPIFFFFFSIENKSWHFMLIICNSHEKLRLIFSENYKEKY